MANRIKATHLNTVDISGVKTVTDQAEITDIYALYLDDESHSIEGKTEKIFFPRSEEELATILKEAYASRTPVTIQGGRTGLTGAAVPLGGYTINLEKMTELKHMDFDEDKGIYTISAEAGVTLEDLVKAVMSKRLDPIKEKGTSAQNGVLKRFLSENGTYSFPVDPTETSAWLGGIVACNASGARTFSHGAVRDWVRRIRVILMNGDLLDIERGKVFEKDGNFEIELSDGSIIEIPIPKYKMPDTKNAAGLFAKPNMDLIDLFIGSEGILGVITEVELGLNKLPENIMTVMAFFNSEDDAVNFVYDIRAPDSPVKMDFIEFFGPNALEMIKEKAASSGITVPAMSESTKAIIFFEFSYTDNDMEDKIMGLEEVLNRNNTSSESSWAGMDYSELQKMKAVRHFVPETVNAIIAMRKAEFHDVHKIGTDMAVPNEALREYLKFYRDVLESQGMEYVIFGHIGNNHLHVNMLPRNNEEVEQGMQNYMTFAKRAVEFGGTVAAEHGIGKLKRAFLEVMYGPGGISQIQAVKRAVDPIWLLNQGNMIPIP
jgi:D-lactate dehydrogenase (cytochrome)